MTEPVPISGLTFDERGLIPVIVQDHQTGEVLMQAYMNEESLQRTVESGRTWFWSRSRSELWRKGDTSGNRLTVRELRVDCDQDAILLKVEVAGDGAARSRLKGLARHYGLDNVSFLPLQSNERFPWLMASGDIHLVIQRGQAADLVMPSKLANILAAGRPFIATARAGTELGRVTAASQAGLLVPPEDGQALAQAILKLAGDADIREEMGTRARRYAEDWLGREAILSCLEDLLYRLTRIKRPEDF